MRKRTTSSGSPSSSISKRGAVRGARLSGRSGFPLDSKVTTWTRVSSLTASCSAITFSTSSVATPFSLENFLQSSHLCLVTVACIARIVRRKWVLWILEGVEQLALRRSAHSIHTRQSGDGEGRDELHSARTWTRQFPIVFVLWWGIARVRSGFSLLSKWRHNRIMLIFFKYTHIHITINNRWY